MSYVMNLIKENVFFEADGKYELRSAEKNYDKKVLCIASFFNCAFPWIGDALNYYYQFWCYFSTWGGVDQTLDLV